MDAVNAELHPTVFVAAGTAHPSGEKQSERSSKAKWRQNDVPLPESLHKTLR